jgi:rod shape-determining protein MreD
VIASDVAKAAALLFVTVVLQVSILSDVEIVHGRPQLLLVVVVCIALLRGAIFGAVAGFAAGLLADTGVFGTLGFTSLLLTLAGYWVGRYGETTGRDRAHAPLLSVVVVTLLYQFGALILHFVLGEPAPAREVLLISLLPTLIVNAALTIPVYALARRLLRRPEAARGVQEARLVG